MQNQGITIGTDKDVLFRNTYLYSRCGMKLKHLVFAMYRHKVLRFNQLKHQFLFLTRGMPGSMQRLEGLILNNLGTVSDQFIHNAGNI